MYNTEKDEDKLHQIEILEKAFRRVITLAVIKELNLLRRNNITGEDLIRNLTDIYHRHGIAKWASENTRTELEIPIIICSEALV